MFKFLQREQFVCARHRCGGGGWEVMEAYDNLTDALESAVAFSAWYVVRVIEAKNPSHALAIANKRA